jgi:hypothetical protein
LLIFVLFFIIIFFTFLTCSSRESQLIENRTCKRNEEEREKK